MLENCFFTWVQTDNFDEAFTIFERMNDRGLPLTMADKVKHYILQTLIDDKEKFSEDSAINKLWVILKIISDYLDLHLIVLLGITWLHIIGKITTTLQKKFYLGLGLKKQKNQLAL